MSNPSPAEIAIQEANEAREQFMSDAGKLFEQQPDVRQPAINPVADALSTATAKAAVSLPVADAKKAGHSPPAKAPAVSVVPGPPSAGAIPTGASEPQGSDPAAVSPQGASPSDDLADVPSADAFDSGKARPTTQSWKKLHGAFDRTTAQLNEARKEVELLRAKAAGVGQQGAVPPPEFQQQLETLQKERDTLIAQLETVAVEKSPRFEQMFKPRIEAAVNQAKLAVGPEKAKEIAELLSQPESAWRDAQIEAITEGLRPLQQQKLLNAMAEMDRVSSERQALSNQGSQLFKQWQGELQANALKQQEERQKAVQSTFDEVVSEWKKANAPLDDKGIATAKEVFMGKLDLRDVATASMWVAVGPALAESAKGLQTENAQLKAELARLKSAAPGNSNDAAAHANNGDDLPENMEYGEAVVEAVRRAGIPFGR